MIDRRNPSGRRHRQERRRAHRQTTDVRIRFMRAGGVNGDVMYGELLDASRLGVRILLECQPAENEKLLIEVLANQDQCFNLTAEVVWSEPTGGSRFHVGCELCVELSAVQHATLKQMMAGLPPN